MTSRPMRPASTPASPGSRATPSPAAAIWKPMALAAWAAPKRAGVIEISVGKIAARAKPTSISPARLIAAAPRTASSTAPISAPIMLQRSSRTSPRRLTISPLRMRPAVRLPQYRLTHVPARAGSIPRAWVKSVYVQLPPVISMPV